MRRRPAADDLDFDFCVNLEEKRFGYDRKMILKLSEDYVGYDRIDRKKILLA